MHAMSPSPTGSSSRNTSPSAPAAKTPAVLRAARRRGDKDNTRVNRNSYPLQRGSACLSCRRRKMKCDAGKPACTQCIKTNRASDCDYDDGKSKSRTQLLQEKITTLEGRLRDLETPVSRPPPRRIYSDSQVPLYGTTVDPVLVNGSPSSFDLTSLSNNGSPTPGSPESLWIGDPYLSGQQGLQLNFSEELKWDVDPLTLPSVELVKVFGRWWESTVPPPRISQSLIDLFLPHRHQCGFDVNADRFSASVNGSPPPHPALLNVVYALACHFSQSPSFTPYISHFASRASRAISAALETSESLLQVLQASCLLAVLFFIKGRLLEGYYHAGAAARLAVGLGLHQISVPDCARDPNDDATTRPPDATFSSSILHPPGSPAEIAERILTFWQVYNLDRCWSVATGLPVALAEDVHPRTRIETSWPRSLDEYEVEQLVHSEALSTAPSVNYLPSITHGNRDSINSLRAKASTLFERAAHLMLTYNSSSVPPHSDQFWSDFHNIDAAISRLNLALPSIHSTVDDHRINVAAFVIHSLVQAATIQLHSPFVFKDPHSRQKSLGVAALATNMIQQLAEVDYGFLDPIMGTCWSSIAEALLRELRAMGQGMAGEHDYNTINAQLDLIVLAMNRLGTVVPLAAYQASKVEQSRLIY